MLVAAAALVFVGPDKLPKMLGTLGRWSNKLRRMTNEVRYQSGIDDMLRQQGIKGGLDEIRELRNLVKGNVAGIAANALNRPAAPVTSPSSPPAVPSVAAPPSAAPDLAKELSSDRSREYPPEGCDAAGAIADDLWSDGDEEAIAEETVRLSQAPSSTKASDSAEPKAPEQETPPVDSSLISADAPAPQPAEPSEPEEGKTIIDSEKVALPIETGATPNPPPHSPVLESTGNEKS